MSERKSTLFITEQMNNLIMENFEVIAILLLLQRCRLNVVDFLSLLYQNYTNVFVTDWSKW